MKPSLPPRVAAPLRLAVLLALDAAVLALARPDPADLRRGLAAPHVWIERVGTDAAAATLAGALVWLAAVWLAVGLLAVVAGAVPGTIGRAGRAVAGGMLPAVLRAGLVGAIGVSVATLPAWAAAASPSAGASPMAGAVASAGAPAPSAHWPTGSGATPGPLPWPGQHAGGSRRSGSAPVVVRAGDSLWSLAAARLGPHAEPAAVAREWPRWYAANRAAIGPDPALIRPGLHLHAPGPAPDSTGRNPR